MSPRTFLLLLLLTFLLLGPHSLAQSSTSLRFTVPGLQCSLIAVGGPDQVTAYVGAFYASDESAAEKCVSVAGPQVMVVASGGDPGATSSNLLVPTRLSGGTSRRLLSSGAGEESDKVRGHFSSLLFKTLSHIVIVPPLALSVPSLHSDQSMKEPKRRPTDEFRDEGFGKDNLPTGGGLVNPALHRALLQSPSEDAGPSRSPGPYFTCPQLPSASWNVSSGPFPDPRTVPSSVVNGSFLLSAGCRGAARSTLFLYNRCKTDIPLTFQITQTSTEYCDLYNFQRYFSNTLFVRVVVMVGGVLACVLVVFSLGCLIGICRNRRLARARARRSLSQLTDQLVASRGQTLLRLGTPRGRAFEVPMYEVNLEKESEGGEARVIGSDGQTFIVVIQPGVAENPSVETLAMSGAISIATEEIRPPPRGGRPGDSVQGESLAETAQEGGGGESSQVGGMASGEETQTGRRELAGEQTDSFLEMLPVRHEGGRESSS